MAGENIVNPKVQEPEQFSEIAEKNKTSWYQSKLQKLQLSQRQSGDGLKRFLEFEKKKRELTKKGDEEGLEALTQERQERIKEFLKFVEKRKKIIKKGDKDELKALQEVEAEIEVGKMRGAIIKLFNSETYKGVDKWLLTYFTIFGPHALEFLAAQIGIPVDESTKQACFDYLSYGIAGAFGLDTIGNTIAQRSNYWASVENKIAPDGDEKNKKSLKWEAAPLINLASMGGSMSEISLENMRIARLLKVTKMSKVALTSKFANVQHSLEDESSNKINKDFTRLIVIFTAAIAAMTTANDFDYTQWQDILIEFSALGLLIYQIKKFNQGVRNTIANVFTRRFKNADERILKSFTENPQLSFLANTFKESGNEIDLLEDRITNLFGLSQELLNPLGEDLELKDGELVTKFVERATILTDIRNWTIMNENYPVEKIEITLAEYFSEMYPIVNRHGGRFANLTGDGAVIYFKDEEDKDGNIIKRKEQKAVECSIDLVPFSEKFDRRFTEKFPIQDGSQNSHKTGIGMKSGKFSITDLFRKRKEATIRKPETIGHTVNRAARIESANKQFPNHIMLVAEDDYEELDERYKKLFKKCGPIELKGLGGVNIWGLPEDFDRSALKEKIVI